MFSIRPILSLILMSSIAICILSGWINFSFSLLSGIAFALLFGNPFQLRTQWFSGHLLKWSVVIMGLGLNIQQVVTTASDGFGLTLATIIFALGLGVLLGHLLKVESRLAFLIAGGTAICGGSAIAALAPAIRAQPHHILIAISIVFLLNAAGLLVYPYLGDWIGLNQQEFGLWAALGIHDTSSVVGAAASFGEDALRIATTTKLARALWIIPLVFVAGYWFKHPQNKTRVPLFILFFIAASLAGSFFAPLTSVAHWAPLVAKRGMALSLFLIGSGFSRQTLQEIEFAALWQGLLLWIFVSVGSLMLIRLV